MFIDLNSAYRVNFNSTCISKGKTPHKHISKTFVKTCEKNFSNTIPVAKLIMMVVFYING